jgi:hypothetical protein
VCGNKRDTSEQRSEDDPRQAVQITIMWLALNEECEAMADERVQRLYVAYQFLGHGGAELETPLSLPKPKTYSDKCTFNFSKSKFAYFTHYNWAITNVRTES